DSGGGDSGGGDSGRDSDSDSGNELSNDFQPFAGFGSDSDNRNSGFEGQELGQDSDSDETKDSKDNNEFSKSDFKSEKETESGTALGEIFNLGSTEDGDADLKSEQKSEQESDVNKGESLQDVFQGSEQEGSTEDGDADLKSEQKSEQESDVNKGESTQLAGQESSQFAGQGVEEAKQKSELEITQEAEVDEGQVKQVAEQISGQAALGGEGSEVKDLLNKEILTNPKGQVSQALESLVGMKATGEIDDSTFQQIAQTFNTQIAQGKDIKQIFAPTIIQIAGEKFDDIIFKDINNYDDHGNRHDDRYDHDRDRYDDHDRDRHYDHDDDHDDDHHHYHTKKIIKYKSSKCLTQTSSIPLTGKIGPRTPVLLGDFYPCEVKDGRATLNLPDDPNIEFVMMHISKSGGHHSGIIVEMNKIQSLSKDNALYVVNFDDTMDGEDPITGNDESISDINAIALYNKSKKTIDFSFGNSLAISAVLKTS
ncbi:MAG TPA: hypothetical protein VK250_10870, partial [Nitrososphaeraceae archaeon]|nr:hypothetical protein [Nitrososphaeraceae archaeon]